jgi:peptidyl-prolyl cis-trans isomerase SurA
MIPYSVLTAFLIGLMSISLYGRTVINKTLALVYTPEEKSLVLLSDLRPGLDGAPKTEEHIILDRLMLADAKKLKMSISEAEVDRHLAKVESQYKLTREQTKELFKNMGYTYEEGRAQLRDIQIREQVKEYRLKSKAMVGKKEVEDYYKEHPQYQEASYTLAQGVVSFKGSSRSIKKAMVQQAIESGDIKTMVQWGPPITLKENEFAQDKVYLKELEAGSVRQLQENEEGITLVQIVAKTTKRLLTFEERVPEISAMLGKDRGAQALEDYKKNLFASARIKHINKEAKAAGATS